MSVAVGAVHEAVAVVPVVVKFILAGQAVIVGGNISGAQGVIAGKTTSRRIISWSSCDKIWQCQTYSPEISNFALIFIISPGINICVSFQPLWAGVKVCGVPVNVILDKTEPIPIAPLCINWALFVIAPINVCLLKI